MLKHEKYHKMKQSEKKNIIQNKKSSNMKINSEKYGSIFEMKIQLISFLVVSF